MGIEIVSDGVWLDQVGSEFLGSLAVGPLQSKSIGITLHVTEIYLQSV